MQRISIPSSSELLPCPFCGSKPEWVHRVHPSGLPGIRCPHCQFIVKEDRIDKTVGFWNRREQSSSYNKALEDVIKYIDEEIILNPQYKDSPRLITGASMVKVKIQELNKLKK